jgi:class 3 adenylate cyclase/tetratricopeptide (TPR) repeat protein
MVTCPRCGTANPEGFRFCGNCAAPLTAAAAGSGERRKVVSVLFCDVAGSTSLGETRDPEQMRAIMARYFETARAALERHGGTVEKFIGDAVMAVFGHPLLHEDDALRAVRAAADLRTELADLNAQLQQAWGATIDVRIGINTGPVVAGEPGSGETLVTGDAVNVAARLQTAAEPGETLIGADTYLLVRDAVRVEELPPLAVKGKELPVSAWRLLGVVADVLGRARHLDSPLVGRERERRSLDEALEQAVSDRACVLFTLLGPAGVGKSRLVHEFIRDTDERARVLRGRCLPYGEGITFWPLAEVLKQAAQITDQDSAETAMAKLAGLLPADEHAKVIVADVAAAIGLSDRQAAGEELFWAVRRLLELMAQGKPLIIVFDDIHWAEPTFLDLIEHISDWSRDAPIMLLCIARPELLEVRPAWAGGKLHATTLMLEALPAEHVAQLMGNLLGESELAGAIVRRIGEAAEGNPLFVEEFVAMLIDDALLREDDGHWVLTGDLDRVTVPPSIRSLLAARIDRLDRRERSVIERASVVGKVFWQGAISELAPELLRPEVRPSLLGLVRKELVRPDRSDFAGDEAFRFRHLLLRDAAYEGVPKHDRGQLHERFASWLERTAGERVAEYEEVLGYHLEQAHRYRSELGQVDDATRTLGLRAARLLASAGLRASDRSDVPGATKLLTRAAELFPVEHPERATLLPALATAVGEAADFEGAVSILEEAAGLAERLGNRSLYWEARVRATEYRFQQNPEGAVDASMSLIQQALAELEQLGDHKALTAVWDQLHAIRYYRGDLVGARAAADRMLEHARLAGDDGRELLALVVRTSLTVFDDTPLEQALGEAESLVERARATGRMLPTAQALGIKGRLLGMRGETEEALRLVEEGRGILRDLGRVAHAAGASHWASMVTSFAGDERATERNLREGADELERLGEKAMLSSSLGHLAATVAQQGRYAEALAESRRAEAITASDDIDAQVQWRVARALALAGLGDLEAAGKLGREALEMADGHGYPIDRAHARLSLASVYGRAFGAPDAAVLLEKAREYYEHKGALAALRLVDAQLAALSDQGVGEDVTAGA